MVILENIRSAHNVGAIFRTSEGAGVSKIFLCGYTPAPIDRFGRVQPEIAKTSLGASEMVAWEAVDDCEAVIRRLQGEGVRVVAVEQSVESVSYTELLRADVPTAFIVGNEVDGVSAAALAAADHIVEIPMVGRKESLNVATTTGIILFSYRDF